MEAKTDNPYCAIVSAVFKNPIQLTKRKALFTQFGRVLYHSADESFTKIQDEAYEFADKWIELGFKMEHYYWADITRDDLALLHIVLSNMSTAETHNATDWHLSLAFNQLSDKKFAYCKFRLYNFLRNYQATTFHDYKRWTLKQQQKNKHNPFDPFTPVPEQSEVDIDIFVVPKKAT